jgi:hypothetical protein
VATKKRRRTQLAKASAQRQQLRRVQRDRRRRHVRLALIAVAALLLAAGLTAWIVMHDEANGPAASASGDYAAAIDLLQDQQAQTAGGAR